MVADSVVFLDAGVAADLARLKRLEHQNKISECRGIRHFTTYPVCARIHLGDGRLGEVRCAADTPAGIAGSREEIAACGPEAGIRTLGFPPRSFTWRKQGADTPLKLNHSGHYVLSAVAIGTVLPHNSDGPRRSAAQIYPMVDYTRSIRRMDFITLSIRTLLWATPRVGVYRISEN